MSTDPFPSDETNGDERSWAQCWHGVSKIRIIHQFARTLVLAVGGLLVSASIVGIFTGPVPAALHFGGGILALAFLSPPAWALLTLEEMGES